ncbi:hypothetical protein HXX76_009114 [Chlamydomonas incerta]|uniref:Pherophorin domain-containing protein n=1 Tax=Chlamydomonas incerta TaxID=51695 RepID=A0A835W089_CHLIN|nr:hypothetical protein HXX76_009114 [Chlamydomonas incerta]|eukprot:KAG2432194.1 hypothetical protein HXX76_009114 [Chlamydomonas incerta]
MAMTTRWLGLLWAILIAGLALARASSNAGWSGDAKDSGASAAHPELLELSAQPHGACTSFELDDAIAVLARDDEYSPLGGASLLAHISTTPGDDAFRLRIRLEPWRGGGYNLSASARALVSRALPASCLTPAPPAASAAATAAAATGGAAGGSGDVMLSGIPIDTTGMQRRLQSAAFAAAPVNLRLVPWQEGGAEADAAAPGAAPGVMVAEVEVPIGAFTCEVVPRRRSAQPRVQQQGREQGQDEAAAAARQQQEMEGDEVEEATRTLFMQLELTVTGPGEQVYLASIGSSYNALPGGCTYATIIASCNPAACRASAAASARRQRRQLAEAAPAAAAALASLERALGKPLPVPPAVAVAVAAVAASVLVLLPAGALVATGVRRLQLKRREWAAAAAAGGTTAAAAAAALALRRSSGGGRTRSNRSRNLSRRGSMLGAVGEVSPVASRCSSVASTCSGLGSAPPMGRSSSGGLGNEGPGSAPATPAMRLSTSGAGLPVAQMPGGSSDGDGGSRLAPRRLLLQSSLSERSRSPSPGASPRRVSCNGIIGSSGGLIGGGGGGGVHGGLAGPGSGHCTPSRLSCMSGGSVLTDATGTPRWSSSGSGSSRGCSGGSGSSRECSGGSGGQPASAAAAPRPAFISTSGLPLPGRRYSCSSGLARSSSAAPPCHAIGDSAFGSSSAAAAAEAAAAPSSGSSSPALLPRNSDNDAAVCVKWQWQHFVAHTCVC